MTRTAASIAIETVDGWVRLAGSRFVCPQEYRDQLAGEDVRTLDLSDLVDRPLLEALARAADEEGLLIGFQPEEFYRRYVSDVLRQDDDPPDWSLTFDRFTAMVLVEMRLRYLARGLLAQRGTGVAADCRLALPADVPPPTGSDWSG